MTEPTTGDFDAILIEMAEAIVDGREIDWSAVQSLPPKLRGRAAQLRSIDSLARNHRDAAHSARSIEETLASLTLPEASAGTSSSNDYLLQSTIPTSWGTLEIRHRLGGGSFGDVYRAFDRQLSREVALKLARPGRKDAGVAAFLNEARQMARVRHANVLNVLGVAEHDGRVGLWTELVEGQTLRMWVEPLGTLGAHEAAPIGVHLCRALSAVHQAGLVHRDIKPENVMRERGGRIILMDLGAAGNLVGGVEHELAGTPLFLSPEQLLDGTAATRASDIYALGVLLYWLVTGRYPVPAENLDELRDKLRCRETVPLRDLRPDLPTEFVQVVSRALALDPAERYPTAGAMEADLARLGPVPEQRGEAMPPARVSLGPEELSGPAKDSAAPGSARLPIWARGLLAVALGVVIVAAAVAGWRTWGHRSHLQVQAAFLVRDGGATRALLDGETIGPQDELALDVQGSHEMYVYVFNEDADGEFFVLFPLAGSLANPLSAGETHRLPSRSRSWQVTTPSGSETLLVLASRQPLADLELLVRDLPSAQPQNPGVLAERGMGGVVENADTEGLLARLTEQYKALAESSNSLWMLKIQLASVTGEKR